MNLSFQTIAMNLSGSHRTQVRTPYMGHIKITDLGPCERNELLLRHLHQKVFNRSWVVSNIISRQPCSVDVYIHMWQSAITQMRHKMNCRTHLSREVLSTPCRITDQRCIECLSPALLYKDYHMPPFHTTDLSYQIYSGLEKYIRKTTRNNHNLSTSLSQQHGSG